jgi:Na+/H+ antiporter NhaD/arsenite permease-like protein
VNIQLLFFVGITVLILLTVCMGLIALESRLYMDKCKPAPIMLLAIPLIRFSYFVSGDDSGRFAQFIEMQTHLKEELFSPIAFLAFMWMVVKLLTECGVFNALIGFLMARDFGARGTFWATGALWAFLSPYRNNITTALIFCKTIRHISNHKEYRGDWPSFLRIIYILRAKF